MGGVGVMKLCTWFTETGGPGVGQGAEGAAAEDGHLQTRRFFSGRAKNVGPGRPAPSLPKRTSKRKTNITCFPLATGQRGGKSNKALHMSKVWNKGLNSTQVKMPWSSF